MRVSEWLLLLACVTVSIAAELCEPQDFG